jgi:hypothetical protein
MAVTDIMILVEEGILKGEPIVAISYLKPIGDWDSGLAAWSSEPNQTAGKPVHLGCFLDDHPEAGKGLELALKHGEATRNDNTWHPGWGRDGHVLCRSCNRGRGARSASREVVGGEQQREQ